MKIELSASDESADDKRQMKRITGDSKQVVLSGNSGESENGEVIDESFGGIGLRFNSAFPFQVGQEFEVLYNDVQLWAIVRHVCKDDTGGSRVGFEWKAVGLSRETRAAIVGSRDEKEITQFKEALPSGFYMMWRLFECEKWFELSDKADNLRRLASPCDFADTIVSYVQHLQDAVKLADPKEATRQALCTLMEACIHVIKYKDNQVASAL